MSWAGRRVLVTGAGGFIGSHLVELLLEAGAHVRAFVRYSSSGSVGNLRHLPGLPDVEVVASDLRDCDALRRAAIGVDTIFHLGALIAIPYSYRDPRNVAETNVMGTLNVLEAARASGARRMVHVSTSEVYGTAQYVPIDEHHPIQSQSPYSASKAGADRLAESYYRAFELPVVTVRPFNTYGPRQSSRAVIPTLISQILALDEISIGATSPTRDFTFVTDTARGMLLAGAADAPWTELNLGNGKEISIGDLAHLIMNECGREVLVRDGEAARLRPAGSEVERLCADARRASESIGWTPEVTLREGIRRCVEFIKAHPDVHPVDRYVT